MIQQPNLEVLNPTTLDDFLDKMEPMEGMDKSCIMLGKKLPFTSLSLSLSPVMLSQVINSTIDMGQSSLPTPFTGGGSTQPYATPTPTQPPLSDGQYPSSTSGYPNGSYMAGFPPSATLSQQQPPQQRSTQGGGFPLSPTSFLSTQGKGNKSTGSAADLASGMPGSSYSMKNEGVAYPGGQQDLVYGSYSQQQQQQQMAPPQGYGAMNRTTMTSPDTNYSMTMKDEASMGTMGQFLNQFLSDPLNPSQVPTDSSQCFQPSASQAQHPLPPSSNMFQFPTSPLQQQQPDQQFESSSLSTLLQQSSAGAAAGEDSSNQGSIARVSSAGNLGLLSEESSTPPIRPPLSRGKSEPIRHLQQQVKHLAEENQRQMMEIEKQQSIAEQQYVAVLQQLAEQQSAGKASREQQEVLKSVLSDPSLVNILREVLLANPPPSSLQERQVSQQSHQQQQQQQRERLPPLNVTPSKMSTDSGGTQVSTPSPLISPSQGSQVGI